MNLTAAELVTLTGHGLVTDSRRVARAFGKQHKNVLRIIEEMRASKEPEIAAHAGLNFEPCIFEVRGGKNSVRQGLGYQMSRDGLTELAMSFTGDKARLVRIRFIAAFNAMAEQLKCKQMNRWQRMYELMAQESESLMRASFGSHLMLERKRELPGFKEQFSALEAEIQQPLGLFGGGVH